MRHELEQHGLSRAALAELAQTDQGYIVKIEAATKCPSLRLFKNLLTAMNISADYVIFGSVEEKGEQMENILQDFMSFLEKKSEREIISLYKIIKDISKYKDIE